LGLRKDLGGGGGGGGGGGVVRRVDCGRGEWGQDVKSLGRMRGSPWGSSSGGFSGLLCVCCVIPAIVLSWAWPPNPPPTTGLVELFFRGWVSRGGRGLWVGFCCSGGRNCCGPIVKKKSLEQKDKGGGGKRGWWSLGTGRSVVGAAGGR